LTREPAEELDGRIAAAFSDDAKSDDAARLLAEVKETTSAAELAAETARKHALDPLLSGDDLKLARREMDDFAFKRDRLQEASAKLTERVEALKALEADRRLQAEHERVSAERDRLAEEMERMARQLRRSLVSFVGSKRATARLGGSTQRRHCGSATFPSSCPGQRPLFRPSFRTPWFGMRLSRSRGCSRLRWGRREGQTARQWISQLGSVYDRCKAVFELRGMIGA
jgi:hypothetical protein